MKDMNAFLDKVVRESALPSITQDRLRREFPDGDWEFTGDHCLHQGELFLHFGNAVDHRMWWVLVEEEWSGESAMTWNMNGMSDLV